MRQRAKFYAAGTLIALAAIYLISTGLMSDTAVYFLTVSEAREHETEPEGQRVRIKGKVRPGSIIWHPAELQLRFVLTDDHQEISVIYRGLVPDLFADGREVIVEGHLKPDGVTAHAILTSCPSKYESEDTAAAHLPP